MSTLSHFPRLTDADFDQACYALSHAFEQQPDSSRAWHSVRVIDSAATTLVRITKALSTTPDVPASTNMEMAKQDNDDDDDDDDEMEEIFQDDPEALSSTSAPCSPTVDYDVLLSPTYRVPVLYISIHDALHRYPPTLDTLYRHVVPEGLWSQTQEVGIIGGITITVRLMDQQ
ncbi:autophagy protein Atg10 [Pyrenophora tritici-repentis]|uniref:Autophagy protein Atg10 n=2 Tax=Pyrenophora tritici-repentis TaxID=45151 RepID=A0A922NCI3_9PLEO|nr:uncharacterized protein PTRG_08693 [Pyrenophora tritici-repentis Pt-1C-BFP]EDU41744.1 conserved hypothetical protein [Pyrenophora tritici-repentis Pt-1C-BFP]KAI1512782.1 autophagy protein Atg10 [Pyrenophora tritici-repentis]KAI1664639.1 autophagy protein Atg10 [Pyrenophora tritici-repentis]KAI1689737.1 autophagy protein Atg10 [Pyrenophora tritici-repentis]